MSTPPRLKNKQTRNAYPRSLGSVLMKLGIAIDSTYRIRIFLYTLQGVIWAVIYPLMWLAAYGNRTEVNGFSREDIITYFLVLLVMEFITESFVDYDLSDRIRDGSMSNLISKPMNLVHYFFFNQLGFRFLRIVLYLFVFFFIGVFIGFPFSLPEQWYTFPLTIIAIIFGHLISFNLRFMVGCLSFWFEDGAGISLFYWFISHLLMGWIAPIAFFPQSVQSASQLMPFQYIMYVPIEIFLEQATLDRIPLYLFAGFLWMVVLIFFRSLLLRIAIRHYNAVGG